MTQVIEAKKGAITEEMRAVAEAENIDPETLRQRVAQGTVVVPANRNHKCLVPIGIGKGLRTKVNANIGTSKDHADLEEELAKLHAALEAGADTVMDLSTGGDIDSIRRRLLAETTVPIGTVPIYQAAVNAVRADKSVVQMSPEDILSAIEVHCDDGVDFITVHCGLTREAFGRAKEQGRITKVVSRGGAFVVEWMIYNDSENPCYERFDDILDIALKNDVTLSLGDGMRPGCLADASDRGQIQELIVLGELADRARKAGVQVMIEGPGHVPINQIRANVLWEKHICKEAPFYVLGPLVTDVAPGYDHITAAIGGAIAAEAGADFLCYVTPSEHLRLPTVEDVKLGVIASRIAAHAADVAKDVPGALEWDNQMAEQRWLRDWREQIKLAIDPDRPAEYRRQSTPDTDDVCTMCGEFCAMKGLEPFL